MAKIHSLKISNFRGIQKLEQVFGITDFICLIGRGDSGKTTILEAISAVLSPSWNLTFYDTDFFNGDIEVPIEIEVSMYDLPKDLIQENKYGLFIRGLDKSTDIIFDDVLDDHETILTLKLIVEKDLEPKWFFVNNREQQDPVEIRASDRANLNVFLVSDYIDRHFSWNKGNPLYSLLKQEKTHDEKNNVIIEALREAKEKIDSSPFNHLDNIVEKIKTSASNFGIDISNTTTTIDFKDFSIKDGRICLHEDKIPFRQKGKGSKRLISIAIQTELAKTGGILLIDEIEQGLEPDRAQHLAKILKNTNKGQIFITTHSRDVLVELNANDLFKVKKNYPSLYPFDNSLQSTIRSNPEAFFSDRVLVCEGPTEIGICRGLNNFRMEKGEDNISLLGVRFANGNGTSQVEYALGFLKAGFKVCLFCDSDDENINKQKEDLKIQGISIVDCAANKSIEAHIFEDLPWKALKELIEYRIKEKDEESVKQSIASKYIGQFPLDWKNSDSPIMRDALYKSSISKKNEWFKRTDHGEFVGGVICNNLEDIKAEKLGNQIQELSKWIDND
jgi:putative ATP-dependent endonuclease of OLD family